jgi:drug/metabolite transporter (DMT)-like permease
MALNDSRLDRYSSPTSKHTMPTTDAPKRELNPFLAVIIGALAVSTAGPFIRASLLAGAPALTIAVLRLVTASVVLTGPALLRVRHEYRGLSRREVWLAVSSGVLLAAHFATWIASFEYTSVMSSVVLVTTTPIWVGLASPIFLGERNSLRIWAGILITIIGSALIGAGDAQASTASIRGNILALAGAILGAGYWMMARRLREKLSLLAYIWLVYGTAAVTLLLWTGAQMLVTGFQPGGFAPIGLLWIVLLALVPQLIGHTSINHGMRHLPATVVSLIVLGEPVGAAILAALFFQEIPGRLQIFGAAVILGGIALGSWAGDDQSQEAESALAAASD